jgi:hypothetical protein
MQQLFSWLVLLLRGRCSTNCTFMHVMSCVADPTNGVVWCGVYAAGIA